MSRAEDAAAALLAILERGRTSGRPGADHELSEVLAEALDGPELTRLWLVARHRLGGHRWQPAKRIDAGHCVVCDQIIGLRPARPLPGGGLIHVACAGEAEQ